MKAVHGKPLSLGSAPLFTSSACNASRVHACPSSPSSQDRWLGITAATSGTKQPQSRRSRRSWIWRVAKAIGPQLSGRRARRGSSSTSRFSPAGGGLRRAGMCSSVTTLSICDDSGNSDSVNQFSDKFGGFRFGDVRAMCVSRLQSHCKTDPVCDFFDRSSSSVGRCVSVCVHCCLFIF